MRPPNSQRLPLESVQESASERPAGMFAGDAVPSVPYTPGGPQLLVGGHVGRTFPPPIQVHWVVDGSNFQRSFRYPPWPAESSPSPPNSHSFPWLSVQVEEPWRA